MAPALGLARCAVSASRTLANDGKGDERSHDRNDDHRRCCWDSIVLDLRDGCHAERSLVVGDDRAAGGRHGSGIPRISPNGGGSQKTRWLRANPSMHSPILRTRIRSGSLRSQGGRTTTHSCSSEIGGRCRSRNLSKTSPRAKQASSATTAREQLFNRLPTPREHQNSQGRP